MDREEWLERRRRGLGSSDAAAACGIEGAFGTPFSVWMDKRGLLPPKQGQHLRWGMALEDVVALAYQEETGREVFRPDARQAHATHPDLGWMMATPDRFASDPDHETGRRVLELKTSGTSKGWGPSGTDEVPAPYLVQVQHQMAVLGMATADIACLIGGQELRTYTVHRDPAIIDRLVAVEADLWRKVEAGECPEVDWLHPDTPRLVQLLHRPSAVKHAALGDDALDLLRQYEQLGAEIKDREQARELIKAHVTLAMGEAAHGHLPDGRVVKRTLRTRKGYAVGPTEYVEFRITHGENKVSQH